MIGFWHRSRPGRTLDLYLASRGPLLARGMSFSAVFSVFAAVYVFFAIFGILFESSTGLRDAVVAGLASTIPGLIDTGGGGAIDVDALFDVQLLGVSGVLVMLALVFTASGWLRSFRAGVRTIFGLPQKDRAFLLMRLIDVARVFALGILMLLSAALSAVLAYLVFSDFLLSSATMLGIFLGVDLIMNGASMISLWSEARKIEA